MNQIKKFLHQNFPIVLLAGMCLYKNTAKVKKIRTILDFKRYMFFNLTHVLIKKMMNLSRKLWHPAQASLTVYTNRGGGKETLILLFCKVLYFFVIFGGQTDRQTDKQTDKHPRLSIELLRN